MDTHTRVAWTIALSVLLAGTVAFAENAGPSLPPVRLIKPSSESITEPTQPTSLGQPPVRILRDPDINPIPDRVELIRPPAPLPNLPARQATPPSDTTPTPPTPYLLHRVDPGPAHEVILNRTTLLVLRWAPARTLPADESRLRVKMVSSKELALTGRTVGTTVLHLWFPDPSDPKKVNPVALLIHVRPEPTAATAGGFQEESLRILQEQINQVFPDSAVRLAEVGAQIVVTGQARDTIESAAIYQLVQENAALAHSFSVDSTTKPPASTPQRRVVNALRIPERCSPPR